MSDWYARTQGATANVATENGAPWDAEDVDFVIAFTDEVTDEDLAITLGRTLSSIWAIQHRIRHDGIDATRKAYARRRCDALATTVATCAVHHIALTASGRCDWCE